MYIIGRMGTTYSTTKQRVLVERYFMIMILRQHSNGIEWQEGNAPLLKSQRRILLYPTLTVTQGTTISRDWILRQTDMKDNQTRN
jgi:hypothetical protein